MPFRIPTYADGTGDMFICAVLHIELRLTCRAPLSRERNLVENRIFDINLTLA